MKRSPGDIGEDPQCQLNDKFVVGRLGCRSGGGSEPLLKRGERYASKGRISPEFSDTGKSGRPLGWGILALISFYLLLKPIYLWRSGIPQIADAVMVLLIAVTFIKTQTIALGVSTHFVSVVFAFAYWVMIINVGTALWVGGDLAIFLSSGVMVVYNAAVAIVFFTLVRTDRSSVVRVIYWSALLSVLTQFVVAIVVGPQWGDRVIGTFNNPNQLAFYGVTSIGLILVCHEVSRAPKIATMIGLVVGQMCILSSQSRSAIAAGLLMLLGSFIMPPVVRRNQAGFRFTLISTACVIAVMGAMSSGVIQGWTLALERRAENSDLVGFSDERGYDRLWNYPLYWFFGGGEGGYDRFGSSIEFHSTLGTVQVSYGVVGLVLYLAILFVALHGNGKRFVPVVIGLIVYGLAHNSLRGTVGWLLVGLIAGLSTLGVFPSSVGGSESRASASCPPLKNRRTDSSWHQFP